MFVNIWTYRFQYIGHFTDGSRRYDLVGINDEFLEGFDSQPE